MRDLLHGARNDRQPQDELVLRDVRTDRYDGGWIRSVEPWIVRQATQKLRAKYSIGGSLLFDHYVFHYVHRDPNRITAVDIAAVDQLMAGNVSSKAVRRVRLSDSVRRDAFVKMLARIPTTASIEDPQWDAPLAEVIASLVQPEIGLAIATKLLMVKRPSLVPMYDDRVQEALDREADIELLQKKMRGLLADNRAAVERLRLAVVSEFGLDVSPLRVLDQLIWFDWNVSRHPDENGYCRVHGFPDWGYNTHRHEQGVYLLDA